VVRRIASLPVTLIVFCGISCSSWTTKKFLLICYTFLYTSSFPPSPAFTCPVCQMFTYFSVSFSDNGTCYICNLFVVLELRLSELKARLCTDENHQIARQVPLVGVEPPSLANPVAAP